MTLATMVLPLIVATALYLVFALDAAEKLYDLLQGQGYREEWFLRQQRIETATLRHSVALKALQGQHDNVLIGCPADGVASRLFVAIGHGDALGFLHADRSSVGAS